MLKVIDRPAAFYCAFACLAIATCFPLLSTQTPALLDYPNHLARIFILTHWDSDPRLQQFYRVVWQPTPNLAFDGLGVVLNHLLPIFQAGQVVLLTAALLLATGIAALSGALYSRPQFGCLFGFFFVFSEMFVYGLVNNLLGFGLCLWAAAVWCWLRRHNLPLSIMVSAAFALVLYFAHLFAFLAYGLIVTSFEFAQQVREYKLTAAVWRTLRITVLPFLIPLAIFVLLSPAGLKTGHGRFGPWISHLTMLISPVRNYSDNLDVVTFLILTALILSGILTGRLHVSREMRLTLLGLAAVSFVVPNNLASGSNAEIRLPTLTVLILAASCRWEPRRTREILSVVLVLISLFAVRALVVMRAFHQTSAFVGQIRAAIVPVPRGSRIGSIVLLTPSQHRFDVAWLHSVCLAVIDKSALVPTLFAFPSQQPLQFAPPYNSLAFPEGQVEVTPGARLDRTALQNLDYVIAINEGVLSEPYLPPLQAVARGTGFTMYHISH